MTRLGRNLGCDVAMRARSAQLPRLFPLLLAVGGGELLAEGRSPFMPPSSAAPEAAAESARTGKPLPSLHSSKFAPVPEPTLKTGVTAMTAAVLELVGKK